jgi:hypothetical protein
LKQAYAKWVKEVKDRSPHKSSWLLGQAEEETYNIAEFSLTNKLDYNLSPYLSGAPIQKRTPELYTSLDSLMLDDPIVSCKKTKCYTESLAQPPRKPLADNSLTSVFNPDGNMLGEYNSPSNLNHFQGISTLLPPKQRAPENNSGEWRKPYYRQ